MRFGGGGGGINTEDVERRFVRAEDGVVVDEEDIMALGRYVVFQESGHREQREEQRLKEPPNKLKLKRQSIRKAWLASLGNRDFKPQFGNR